MQMLHVVDMRRSSRTDVCHPHLHSSLWIDRIAVQTSAYGWLVDQVDVEERVLEAGTKIHVPAPGGLLLQCTLFKLLFVEFYIVYNFILTTTSQRNRSFHLIVLLD
jgi:hypothetical protein